MKEIRSLTGLRGIAALYVALYHSMEIRGYDGDSMWQIFINHGDLAVDIFFLLSGFVMAYSSGKLFDEVVYGKNFFFFIRRRFARIYPMYILVLTFSFIFINHFDGKINYLIGLTLLTILSGKSYVVVHLWSISTEWVAYLIFPILYKLGTLKKNLVWNSFLIIICFTILFLWYKYPEFLLLPNHSANSEFTVSAYPTLLKCFTEYILGIVAFNLYKNLFIYNSRINILTILNSVLLIVVLILKDTSAYVTILSFSFIFLLSKEIGFIPRLLSSKPAYFLGNISYSLYLIHPIFLFFFKKDFYYFFEESILSYSAFNILYVLSIISISYLTYTYIELPMQILLKGDHKKFLDKLRLTRP